MEAFTQSFTIAATVNDIPISEWDVSQRKKFHQITGLKISKDALHEQSLNELVEETLMISEAKRVGVSITVPEVRNTIDRRLKPLKRTFSQFNQYLSSSGVGIATFKNQIRAHMLWSKVIAKTYRNQLSISETDINKTAQDLKDHSSGDIAEIIDLQRIFLEVPDGVGDGKIMQLMQEAERIRTSFINCKRNKTSLKGYSNIKVEDMVNIKADSLPEPTKSLVLQAKEGEIIPANFASNGIELFAICKRREDGDRKKVAKQQLLNQELGMLASRHIRDLRQDAVVDYR
jgi:peptidyl-prolyl cis-trans isomerase SurA